MYLDINKYLFILIGWLLLRTSYQLRCLQCTSFIRHISSNWNNSCVDGTSKSLPCPKTINGTEQNDPKCVSALYRGGNGVKGVMINRHCANNISSRHDCDPPRSLIDFHKSNSFYCSYTCSFNGCNKQLVEDIFSNGIQLLKTNHYIAFIFVYYRIFHTIYTLDLQVITS